MSSDKIKHLSDKQRAKTGGSVKEAIRRAKQHIRNVGSNDLDEPEGFASGDMKKFIENPDKYEKDDDEQEKNK